MGAPEEQDGLSPITRSNSRNVTRWKVTFRDCPATETFATLLLMVDLLPRLPALEPPPTLA